jgi:hypothetical protein
MDVQPKNKTESCVWNKAVQVLVFQHQPPARQAGNMVDACSGNLYYAMARGCLCVCFQQQPVSVTASSLPSLIWKVSTDGLTH